MDGKNILGEYLELWKKCSNGRGDLYQGIELGNVLKLLTIKQGEELEK
jgi:hypothetical protein